MYLTTLNVEKKLNGSTSACVRSFCRVRVRAHLSSSKHVHVHVHLINTVDDIYLMSDERYCLPDSKAVFDNIHISYRALSLFSGSESLTILLDDGD